MAEPTVPVPVSLTEQQIRDAIDVAYNERYSHVLLPLTDHEWTAIVHGAAEAVFALLSPPTPTAAKFNPRVTLTQTIRDTPPSIADMVSGTTFRARFTWSATDHEYEFKVGPHGLVSFLVWEPMPRIDRIDPSTIRDVHPPSEATR